jgi:hypothetical protein
MEKFRVISDLHIDYNHDYDVKLKKDSIFTVIAGDIGGQMAMFKVKPSRKTIYVRMNGMDNDGMLSELIGDRKSVNIEYIGCGDWTLDKDKINPSEYGITITAAFNEFNVGDYIKITKTTTFDWIRKNVSKGVFIAGNHIVYNYYHKTIEELKNDYAKEFPLESDITFLDCESGVFTKEVDGILFVGTTLYTNYELPVGDYNRGATMEGKSVDERIAFNMRIATPKMSGGGMNDFQFGLTDEGTYTKEAYDSSDHYYLRPQNYLEFFKRSFAKIKEVVENNSDKQIVIVTHHCPSIKCISKEYVDDWMNASYVSDLDDFIISHPQIKCWICGHVHHRGSFKIGNCLCVMNPLGYCKHGQFKASDGNENWSPDVFVNVKDWSVEKKPYVNKKWESNLKKYREMMSKYLPFFMI